jgi:transcriptional regulator
MTVAMYLPASFEESERPVVFDLIERHGFATFISGAAESAIVTHLPLLLDRSVPGGERLLGHVARANRHWSAFDGKQGALAIFHGPHGYVSPSWYKTQPSVPTWNYAVVHVYGTPTVVDTAATRLILGRLVDQYEAERPARRVPDLPPALLDEHLRAIVGFEMPIARIEAKFKLSQNRDAADRAGALAGLEHAEDGPSRELALFTRRYFARKTSGG